MNRTTALFTMLAMIATLGLGCSGSGNPAIPNPDSGFTSGIEGASTHTFLWGYYDVLMDLETETVQAIPNRNMMFTLNVVQFLNMNPSTLSFSFNSIENMGDYVDVDLDVSITHPIPGKPNLNGYDVRGCLIAEGSAIMAYNTDLRYAVNGMDQFLLNADGYTRWYNRPEFQTSGIFGYTQGIYASKNLIFGDATINPYKFFADGLGPTDDLWEWLNANAGTNAVFSSGSTNTRNYVIRFPIPTPSIQYGYAIIANWGGGQPGDHPSNAVESGVVTVTVTDNIYYVDETDNGGDLIFDFGFWFWDWGGVPSVCTVESTVLSAAIEIPISEMEPIYGSDYYAVWHYEIPADGVLTTTGNEFWITATYPFDDYSNPFGVPNDADGSLTAFFRNDLFVSDTPFTGPPEITAGVSGGSTFFEDSVLDYTVTAVDPDGDPLTYAWSVWDTVGPTEVFSGPGDGAGSFTVDWAADVGPAVDDQFTIRCDVSDGIYPPVAANPLLVTCIEKPNEPPEIIDGVTGDTDVNPTDIDVYSVTAVDPEMDPLSYDWLVRDTTTGMPVMVGSGDGAGNFTVDWDNDIGSSSSEIYIVECAVNDPTNPPVMAIPLIVTIL